MVLHPTQHMTISTPTSRLPPHIFAAELCVQDMRSVEARHGAGSPSVRPVIIAEGSNHGSPEGGRAYRLCRVLAADKPAVTIMLACPIEFDAVSRTYVMIDGPYVVIKIVKLSSKEHVRQAEAEIRALRRLELSLHANPLLHVAPLLDLLRDSHHLYIVLPYLEGGDLFSRVSELGCGLPVAEARLYFWQVLQGLLLLKRHGIAHGDMSCENVLLTRDPTCPEGQRQMAKLIDLGSCHILPTKRGRSTHTHSHQHTFNNDHSSTQQHHCHLERHHLPRSPTGACVPHTSHDNNHICQEPHEDLPLLHDICHFSSPSSSTSTSCSPSSLPTAAQAEPPQSPMSSADNLCPYSEFHYRGKVGYVPPEVVCDPPAFIDPYKVDIWSCGILLYVLLSGRPLYSHQDDPAFLLLSTGHASTLLKHYESFGLTIDSGAEELVCQMLHPDPNIRPSVEDLLAHPWVCGEGASENDDGGVWGLEEGPAQRQNVWEGQGVCLKGEMALENAPQRDAQANTPEVA